MNGGWRKLRPTLLLVLLACGVLAPPAAAEGSAHVRVVLDVSRSMRANDPGRQAILATLLLRDLVSIDPTRGDSFVVYPFHRSQKWHSPGDPPPRETAPPIRASDGDRTRFHRALEALTYTADWTYFLPGIRASLDDLRATPGGADDARVVILVTDGVPEKETRDAELEHIRRELLPDLERHGIRLYVLAFGQRAYEARDFFEQMQKPASGAPLGAVFPDRDGRDLLTPMTRIFARAFGYDEEAPRDAAAAGPLDLKGTVDARRVAVVVLSSADRIPSLRLSSPSGGSVSSPGGVVGARTSGGAYALQWVLSPARGGHPFATDALRGEVAVLRPTRVVLEIVPAGKGGPTERTMAETPFRLGVLVRPLGGAGDPGPVDLSFTIHTSCRADSGLPIEGGSPPAPPVSPGGTVTSGGRLYEIEAELPSDSQHRDFYRGCIQLRAMRGGAVVGSLLGQHAHRVDVYPLLRLSPSPLEADATLPTSDEQRALHRRQTACARFRLAVESGELPHPDRPRYPVRVALASSVSFTGPLRDASVTLDGRPLEVQGRPATTVGGWYDGIELDRNELLGEHRVCLHLGRPASGDPSEPLRLPLLWTLLETPYQDFEVVRPFTLTARVARPLLIDRIRPLLILLLLLLILLGTLVHLRDRPNLPRDLCVAIARDGHGEPEPRELPEPSLLRRCLGLVSERPIAGPDSDRTLAWVSPSADEIYRVRPARGVRIEPADPEEELAPGARHHPLSIHRDYRLVDPEGVHRFRLEFR